MKYRRQGDAMAEQISKVTGEDVESALSSALKFYKEVVMFEKQGYEVMAVFEKATTLTMKKLRQ